MKLWSIDKSYLRQLLDKCNSILNNPNISSDVKREVLEDSKIITNYLGNNFEYGHCKCVRASSNMEECKTRILKNMRKVYTTLGRDACLWAISLYEEGVFEDLEFNSMTKLPLDTQRDLTEKNYSMNFGGVVTPNLFNISLNGCSSSHVQVVKGVDFSSYMVSLAVSDVPFMIINSKEAPWVYNHEFQHIEEELRGYRGHAYYSEVGAIYLENLFLDRLREYQGFIKKGDYSYRLLELDSILMDLYDYFCVMLSFAEKDFNVNLEDFINIISFQEESKKEDINPTTLKKYYENEIYTDIMYLFSTIKDIELYEEFKDSGVSTSCFDHENHIKPFVTRKKFIFKKPDEGIKVYKKYIERMEKISK